VEEVEEAVDLGVYDGLADERKRTMPHILGLLESLGDDT